MHTINGTLSLVNVAVFNMNYILNVAVLLLSFHHKCKLINNKMFVTLLRYKRTVNNIPLIFHITKRLPFHHQRFPAL